MPRISVVAVVVIVVAIAVAAIVDSVRKGNEQQGVPKTSPSVPVTTDPLGPPPAEPELAQPEPAPLPGLLDDATRARAASALQPEGVRGVLYITTEDCTFYALTLPDLAESRMLPDLAESRMRARSACQFAVDPGAPPAGRGVARDAGRTAAAICRGGRVEILHALPGTGASPDGAARARIRGCAPAWKPGGELTLVRDGELLAVGQSCHRPPSRCVTTILARPALASAVSGELAFRDLSAPEVEEVVWLSDERFVAVLSASSATGERTEAVALFEGDVLVDVALVTRPNLDLVRVSPLRSYVAVRAGESEGIFVLRPRHDRLSVARFPPWAPPAPTDIRGIAWSPDERFTAVASRRSVYVFHTGEARQGFTGLPFSANDLAWGPA